MPTRLSFGDYETWITVEGEEIEHYDVEVDEEKKVVTCWIASQEGKHFAICGLKKHTNFQCSMKPHVDGIPISGKIIGNHSLQATTIHDAIESGGTSRLLMFSRLDVTGNKLDTLIAMDCCNSYFCSVDDDALLHDSSSQSIGEIEVIVRRSQIIPGEANFKALPGNSKVHERSKKAMTHRVGFGEQIQTACTGVNVVHHEVVATFIFRYRSLDMLRANGIAPRPPPPPNEQEVAPSRAASASSNRKAADVKEEESDEELDPDELEVRRKEEEEIAQLVAEKMERIKNARNARKAKQPPKKKVKQEPQADARPVFIPGEVIDLT